MEEIESHWSKGDKKGLMELILSRTDLTKEQVLRIMMYAEKSEGQRDDGQRNVDVVLGPDKKWAELSKKMAVLESKLVQKESKLAEREAKLVEREAKLEEKLAKREAKLEQRLIALEKAEELLVKLEKKIQGLEQRLETLLEKVETGEYFGPTFDDTPLTQSFNISFDGAATWPTDKALTILGMEILVNSSYQMLIF